VRARRLTHPRGGQVLQWADGRHPAPTVPQVEGRIDYFPLPHARCAAGKRGASQVTFRFALAVARRSRCARAATCRLTWRGRRSAPTWRRCWAAPTCTSTCRPSSPASSVRARPACSRAHPLLRPVERGARPAWIEGLTVASYSYTPGASHDATVSGAWSPPSNVAPPSSPSGASHAVTLMPRPQAALAVC
jgi:hypothetical protein